MAVLGFERSGGDLPCNCRADSVLDVVFHRGPVGAPKG
jgi:hypothetical protein